MVDKYFYIRGFIMNLKEVLVEPDMVEDDGITLTRFDNSDVLVDPWLAELCSQLLYLDSEVSVRMVLWLYLGDRLPGVQWGGESE